MVKEILPGSSDRCSSKAVSEAPEQQPAAARMPDGIAYFDPAMRYLFVNKGIESSLGLPASEIIGKTLEETHSPATYYDIAPKVEAALNGQEASLKHTQITPDGASRLFRSTFVPEFDDQQEVVGCYALTVDVTEQYKAETRSREIEKRLEFITDDLGAILTYLDTGRIYQFVNREFTDTLGIPAEEIIGKSVDEFETEAMKGLTAPYIDEALSGKTVTFERKRPTADGTVRNFQSTYRPHLDDSGKTIGVVGLSIDITELKNSEKALQESEAVLRLVTDNIPGFLVYYDTDHNYRFGNKGLEELLGRPLSEIIGKHSREIQGEDVYQSIVPYLERAMSGETVAFEQWRKHPDGASYHYQTTYLPHLDENGQVLGCYAVGYDTTERVEVQRQLNQAHKMDAIGHLTGGIAHDFNNILMVTDGYTRRALKAVEDPKAVAEALEEVLKGTDRAANLTKQLLSFSRRQIMEKRVFRVEEAITEIKSLLDKSTTENIELVIESNSEGACVETDPSEFHTALLNLVINARDAMHLGGRIEINSRVIEVDEAFAATQQNMSAGRFVEVSVKDSGTGIDPETLSHIFEPFFTTKDQGKGTGLGLAMIYGFAQSSSGGIAVKSEENVGTIFKIYLPAVDRDPEAIIAEVAQDHHGKGETVLIVEDDPALLDLGRDVLDSLGYNVLTACDGFAAMEIEAEHEEKIDLLLSDVVMPMMGGFEVAEMIREARPEIRIVFMSGYPNRAGIGNEHVPDDCQFLQKPVKPGHLAQTLRQELERATA